MRRVANVQELAESEFEAVPGAAAHLSVSLVGRLTIRFKGRLIELRTQKAGAVLSYLALTETKHESRERLVGLLWSRSDEEKARASLRQVVRELRAAFEEAGCSGFVAGRLSIHLDAENVEVDVESIIRAAEGGNVHPLLLNTPQLGERILEGMDDLDPSFRVWVLAKRQTIHDRLMRSLGAGLVADEVAAGAKSRIATAIFNLDPTHEEACCHLMRTHAEEGDVAGALRIYKALWDLLDRDYGMEPSPVTEELVAKIKLGAFERPLADSGARGAADKRTLRVINGSVEHAIPLAAAQIKAPAKMRLVLQPFAMHGIDNDHAHLVQGFNQHLAASLVRFREWSVVDRVTAAVPPAQDSAPQYCIEATAYRAGDDINMVMVLKDDRTGIYVWSESFRLGLNNWFEAQQRIIRRIAMSLNVQLSAERLMRLAGEPDVSLDAHDRWLRGQSLHFKYDAESWQRAVTIFRDAIRENPTFSPCYSSLVQMNNVEHFVHPGVFRDLGKAKATLELAKRAVQLDPVDSRAHLCCGWSYVMALREAEAAPHMDLACELNDNDPWTLLSSAACCAFCGSIDQARLRAEQSLALSSAPSYLGWGYHGIIRVLSGEYAGALEAIDRAEGVIKTLPAWRAAALFHLGQLDMAREEAQRFLNGIRSFWIGSSAPTDEAVVRWTLEAHPISVGARWEVLRDGLGGAGLPVEGIVQLS
ncbi:BTAD domain-containing putative transcriptional regulator [Bradyrhizobium canariense]|uniref:DNA-binding transcriptional activator of the SARP family n=1 Tax=Bradyrhizobium canariense TaxID=255045 RepID=A0A1H1UAX5_9BRAD|nr:BTAD domain-containing putative transcriptional regulator [Bradyrhizobium canariense]SDS69563.1 DNA-binding transcriptional activator of the SARP family [Bradyrhizobium canariense]